MSPSRIARTYFLATAILVILGVGIEVFVSAGREASYFDTPPARVLNLFTYFTILSNIVVGLTSYLLATRPGITSQIFWGFRLSGVLAMIITFLVQHFIIAGEAPLLWPFVSDLILHTIVPLMAVGGWLAFGPYGVIKGKTIVISMIFPIAWLVFVFIRGAKTNWYPYDFLDAHEHGYLQAALYVGAITIVFLVLAFVAKFYDQLRNKLRV